MVNEGIEMDGLHTYAEPLAGLRVSWGAVLAGALTCVGVALLLWSLALAITLTATSGSPESLRNDFMVLWITGMATTLIGAVVGGGLGGYLPGNPRRLIGGVHGFLAWAVAFVAVSATEGVALGHMMDRESQDIAAMEGGRTGHLAASGLNRPDIASLLRPLGYTPAEIARVEADLDTMTPQAQTLPGAPESRRMATGTAAMGAGTTVGSDRAAREWSAGLAWSWFGTWAVAALLSTLAGARVTDRLTRPGSSKPPPVVSIEVERTVGDLGAGAHA
jgi:hypothetical protein